MKLKQKFYILTTHEILSLPFAESVERGDQSFFGQRAGDEVWVASVPLLSSLLAEITSLYASRPSDRG